MPLDLNRELPQLLSHNATAATAYRGARVRRAENSSTPVLGTFCPVCRRWSRHFLTFGLARRRAALCPICGSLERHRFLWMFLEKQLRLPFQRAAVLHIAPEYCIRRRLIGCPAIRYTAIDLYDPAAALRMDIRRLEFDDAHFDFVICCHVLEHIADDKAALEEIARVLKPGGHAVIMVPLDPSRATTLEDPSATTAAERHELFGHPYHHRLCGRDYGERIARAGLGVAQIDSARLAGHQRRYFRINKAILYDCRRRGHAKSGPAGCHGAA